MGVWDCPYPLLYLGQIRNKGLLHALLSTVEEPKWGKNLKQNIIDSGMHVTESLYCTVGSNPTLLNSTPIQKKKNFNLS